MVRKMKIDAHGWVDIARHILSPNFDQRPDNRILLLVIHNISLPPNQFGGDGIERLFTNTLDTDSHPYYQTITGLKVSSHFLIRRDGQLVQFVSCNHRAWHAGESSWQGRGRCNDYSIGIELEGSDSVSFTDMQYEVLVKLTVVLRARYSFGGIAGHSDISPQRKTDPGPCFNWMRYLKALTTHTDCST